ncbi:MAG TPA: BTAD domain-containing putative transcriptional regulator [Gemmatimonadaceae bacterium]|nr:BTAD domain-containing putative transcriptional regulator [Gemmatimonadaceae bacterium]
MVNSISLLGPVSLTGPKGKSLRRASQQRRIALLALVASSPGESISRDRVLGFLWPDRDERTARHLLADSLYVLRQSLGDRAITTSGETLRLSPDVVWIDVVEFRRALTDERWSDALQIYRGDFLDGFFVRNAVDFDQWAMSERDRLREVATRAASRLVDALIATGRLSEAVAAAERALELTPCDEPSFRKLLNLLFTSGNRSRADAVARRFVERLASEIGVSPSAETMLMLRQARALAATEQIVVVAPRRRSRQRGEIDSVTASIILQGRHHWDQRTRPSVGRAITYFTRAVERDARAVEGWSGLADSWVVMGGRGYAPVAVAIERATDAANRALAIDDAVSCVHTSLGGLNILRRRWRDAQSEFGSAIDLDPQNADARHWLSMSLLTGFGSREEAVREQTIAANLDPVSSMNIGVLGWQRYLRGEYDLSRSNMEPALDLNADFEEGHAGLARVAARLGDEATVMRTIDAGLARHNDQRGDLLAEQASALAVLGDRRRARQLALEATRYEAMPLNLALAWASVGDSRRALEYLDRESFSVYWAPQAMWWDPRFDQIRDEVRFARALDRVGRVWSPEWQ